MHGYVKKNMAKRESSVNEERDVIKEGKKKEI